MSQTPVTTTSSSNFRAVFVSALREYEKKTKTDLHTHPLATQLQSCQSSSDILAVLHDIVNEFDQSRIRNERLSSWLGSTINVLYAFSATLGEGVGLANILARKSNLCWHRGPPLGRQGCGRKSRCPRRSLRAYRELLQTARILHGSATNQRDD
ncbi:hypothetical protein EDB86DRAFT_1495453 [Lactarius hatsudake]|nr:hypothetical protein EDB86DRAFT_1495453 [Lactarius hatsudake]